LNNKGVVENEFSAEEHMSRNQKTGNQFCIGLGGHVEIYQCVVNDKQAPNTIASKMSN